MAERKSGGGKRACDNISGLDSGGDAVDPTTAFQAVPLPVPGRNENARLQANKHRDVQVARTGGRKLFDEERKGVFLEWFAATANVSLSAEQAGISYKTAFKHRMNDADFAADWDRALEQAVARLKAKLLESKAAPRPGIDGDLDAAEMEDVDPQIGLAILRESERRLAGYPKTGAAPRVATNAEVRESLAARLRAFRARVRAERRGKRSDSLPLDGGGREGVAYPSGTEQVESPPPPQPCPIKGEGAREGED